VSRWKIGNGKWGLKMGSIGPFHGANTTLRVENENIYNPPHTPAGNGGSRIFKEKRMKGYEITIYVEWGITVCIMKPTKEETLEFYKKNYNGLEYKLIKKD